MKKLFSLRRECVFLMAFCFSTGCFVDSSLCPDGSTKVVVTRLYMGLSSELSHLQEQASMFVSQEILAKHLPGWTLSEATGGWVPPGQDQPIVERSFILAYIHDGDIEEHKRIENVRKLYKSRFNQQEILRIDEFACKF